MSHDCMQVKHSNVVQVSLIIVSVNSSTHVGRYTLTASNVAGTASASIVLRLTASSSLSTSSYSHAYHTATDDDVKAASVLQHPDTGRQQLSGIVSFVYTTVRASRRRREMHIVHVRLCV